MIRDGQGTLAELKEPHLVVRLFGHRCTECGGLAKVTNADLARNQRVALQAVARVHVSPSVYRDLFR